MWCMRIKRLGMECSLVARSNLLYLWHNNWHIYSYLSRDYSLVILFNSTLLVFWKVESPMILEIDNKGAVCLLKNWSVSGRTHHETVRKSFLRELNENGIITVKCIPTEKKHQWTFHEESTRTSIWETCIDICWNWWLYGDQQSDNSIDSEIVMLEVRIKLVERESFCWRGPWRHRTADCEFAWIYVWIQYPTVDMCCLYDRHSLFTVMTVPMWPRTSSSFSLEVANSRTNLDYFYWLNLLKVSLRRPTRFRRRSVQRGNVDSARRNPEGWASGFKNYKSHLGKCRASCVPVRCLAVAGSSWAHHWGARFRCCHHRRHTFANTDSSQCLTTKNDDHFQLHCVPLVGGLVVARQMTCQIVCTGNRPSRLRAKMPVWVPLASLQPVPHIL
jgi:hypothetical protein